MSKIMDISVRTRVWLSYQRVIAQNEDVQLVTVPGLTDCMEWIVVRAGRNIDPIGVIDNKDIVLFDYSRWMDMDRYEWLLNALENLVDTVRRGEVI